MPTLESELFLTPVKTGIQVAIEPAVNALGSLLFLSRVERYSGLDPWIVKTAESLDKGLLQANLVVMQGLFYAWTPNRSWDSFASFVDNLEATDPLVLRDRILDTYLDLPCKRDKETEVDPISKDELLSDFDTFIAYLQSKFGEDHVDEVIEKEAYRLLLTPEKMRSYIVSHFRTMWTEVLGTEWERVHPLIEESALAFQKVDFNQMTEQEAVRFITGHSDDKVGWLIEQGKRLIFIPSTHSGPYSLPFLSEDTVWILFRARLPEGLPRSASVLSRSELLVRLTALADETRLSILAITNEREQICSQELIDILQMSQSSVSRHLRQLSASGFLRERRTEAGKCYTLNPERLKDTLHALEVLFSERS
ncbi:MAG: metalloregulator ArsR/SmtB family transcription factor [Anaerolineales bacterium]